MKHVSLLSDILWSEIGRFTMKNLFPRQTLPESETCFFVAQTPVHNLGKPNVKLLFTQVEALSVFAALIGAILASRLVDTVHIVHI